MVRTPLPVTDQIGLSVVELSFAFEGLRRLRT